MTQELIIVRSSVSAHLEADLTRLAAFAQAADTQMQDQVLARYRVGKATNTIRTQQGHLAAFEHFLASAGISLTGFSENLSLWSGVTHGLLLVFRDWQLTQGVSIKTINDRITTTRTYCRLAYEADHLPIENWERIQLMKQIREKEGRNIDEKRDVTRIGKKKAEPTRISPAQFGLLKRKLLDYGPRDVTACRDLLMVCLLAEHGLRCSETEMVRSGQIDYIQGTMRFYRKKTHLWQFHQLTPDTYFVACRYRDVLQESTERVLDIASRTINWRVQLVGEQLLGILTLSPHDLRHYFATYAEGDLADITEAGGWKSTDMAYRYRLEQKIANSKVIMPNQVCR